MVETRVNFDAAIIVEEPLESYKKLPNEDSIKCEPSQTNVSPIRSVDLVIAFKSGSKCAQNKLNDFYFR